MELLSSGAWVGIGALASVAMMAMYLVVERRKIFGDSALSAASKESALTKDSTDRELAGMFSVGVSLGIFLSFLLLLRSSSVLWLAQTAQSAFLGVVLWGVLVPLPVAVFFALVAFSIGKSASERIRGVGFFLLPYLGVALSLSIVYILFPSVQLYAKELAGTWF